MKKTRILWLAGLAFPCAASLQTAAQTGDSYPLHFDQTVVQPDVQSKLHAVNLVIGQNGNLQQVQVPEKGIRKVYNALTDQAVDALIGEKLNVTCDYSGEPLHSYFYIDFNQDGQFTAALDVDNRPTAESELVSFTYYNGRNSAGQVVDETVSARDLPAYSVPANMPAGVYRARLKLDKNSIDPAGSIFADGFSLGTEGGYVIDFLLNVRNKDGKLDLQTVNGSLVGEGNWGVPKRIDNHTAITLMPVAIAEGYEPGDITVRHGQNLDGEQYIQGNRQWEEYTVPFSDLIEIPADKVDGDVRVSLTYEPTDAAEYTLQFCDEFNQPDGSAPSDKNWVRCYSWGSTWDRTNAQTLEGKKKTAYIEDGKLVALCIKNPYDDEKLNGVRRDMISGAVESHGKFDFTYGKVEGRLATNAYRGNFPAFWMMPSKAEHGDWPMDGEIDIFEQIDYEDISYHTVHSNWTYNLGQANNPSKGGTSYTITGDYHVYTFEWTENKLTWYTDGRMSFSYAKSNNQYALDNLQWPFYKNFYLILNQSVGNGSWAKPCDVNHVYRTDFDWVRVYQKGKPVNPETGIRQTEQTSDLDVYGFRGAIHLVAVHSVPVRITDMQGRIVYSREVQGNVDVALDRGIYVVNGKKVLVR